MPPVFTCERSQGLAFCALGCIVPENLILKKAQMEGKGQNPAMFVKY